jgi:hypothetical protein
MDNIDKPFLTVKEHSKAFCLAENTVKNRLLNGTWPARSVRVGKLILIPMLEHQRVIKEMLAAVGIQPPGWVSGIDPHQPPCRPDENQASGLKRGRGRPRKSAAGVK